MLRWETLAVLISLFPGLLMAEAYTGKIVIDGVVVGESGSGVVAGSGRRSRQRRPLPCFSEITVRAGVDLVVRRGTQCEVIVEADDNLIPLIGTEVSGGRLILSAARSFQSQGRVRVEATTDRLERLEVEGASDVRLTGIDSPSLAILLSGSGDVTGDGRAGRLAVEVSGSGDIRLGRLRAEDVKIRITGAADAEVHAARSLKVDLEGSGDVLYFGNPAHVEKNIRGAGDVEAAE